MIYGTLHQVDYNSVIASPLASRAWVLQERLLSPRTLHFSKTELFWECRHCDASESFPNGLPEFENKHVFVRDRKPLSEIWHTIVRLYAAAKLSFRKDKKVAISGIARLVQKDTQDQCLAGLWRNDIELQLLWYQLTPGKEFAEESRYLAPSWSWASVDEREFLSYDPRIEENRYKYYAHVIDAHVVPAGNDPFGELVGGQLRMSCSVMLAGKQGRSKRGGGSDDTEVEIESADSEKEGFSIIPDSNGYDGEDICVLPVVNILREKDEWQGIRGLLLIPTGNKKGEYIRVGCFDLSLWGASPGDQERFLKLLELCGKATAEVQCAETLSEPEFSDERYIITII